MNDIGGILALVAYLAILVLTIAGYWATFEKAGRPGWAALIPIYNLYVVCKMAGKPGWWVLLLLVPILNLVVTLIIGIAIAYGFGRSTAFGIGLGLVPPIFAMILGFGDDRWQGAPGSSTEPMAAPA